MAKREMITLDFETKGIKRRPEYPPKPVGLSIIYPGKKPEYFAWGHPVENNCSMVSVKQRLKDIERSGVDMLFHNAKFDIDVAQVHMGMGDVDWRRIHDTLYLLFLDDPHARSLSLKPSSERVLDMPPAEQDRVKDWVLAHKAQIEAKTGEKFKPSEWGAYIGEAPGKLVGTYANGDTLRTRKLYDKLMPTIRADDMEAAYDRERQLMPIMLANEREGIRIDLPKLLQDIKLYTECLNAADNWLRKRLKTPGLNLDADKDVADALEKCGVVTDFNYTAPSKTHPAGVRSVSKKNLTLDMFKDAKVARALGYRNRLQTCLSTFMGPWAILASANGGYIHTNWNQVRNTEHGSVGARTGRMSCSPNFMNIPTEWLDKGDDYAHPAHLTLLELPLIRRYVLGDDKGHDFGGRDYNQQELRILGHFEDDELMRAYQNDPTLDTHKFVQDFVQEILHREVRRKIIKEVNFGTIYGQGVPSLAEKLGEEVSVIKQIKAAQLRALPGLKSLNDGIKQGARDGIPIRTWGGRIYYKEPSIVIRGRTVDFSYKLLNYLIQGSAADCTKQAVINYDAIKRDGRFLAQVHDEVNISAPKKAMKAELKLLGEAMLDVNFDVPMLSEPYMGANWGDVVKYKEAL